jgi:outer membrane murein-binding lipoprotein Lpp
MKTEILTGVKGEIVDVVREIRDVAEKLGIDAARQEEFERTAVKGFAFEDVLDECVGRLAAQHGDLHERCGTETGATGSKVGDEAVTLNLADSYGVEARFVFEAKDRKLPMRKILAELDEAMANRGAQFAIGVFRSQEAAPTAVPFHCVGNDKAVVVLDDGGDLALRLAYLWARMTVRAGLGADSGDEIDVERMSALVTEARRALEMLSTVKGCHSKARNAIDQASTQVAELVDHVRAALDQLDSELSAAESDAVGSVALAGTVALTHPPAGADPAKILGHSSESGNSS